MRCPGCKAENKDGVKFCKHCGFNIKEYNENRMVIFCTECGTKLDFDARHCTECGAAVVNESSEDGFISFFELDEMDKLLDDEISKTKASERLCGFEYITHTDGTVTVTGVKDKSALSYVVPEGVVCIGEGAFRDSKAMSVTLPEGLLIIEDYAFSGCKNLEDINYPTSLSKIGKEAFTGCESLESVAPKGVKLGENAYTGTVVNNIFGLTKQEILDLAHIKEYQGKLYVEGVNDKNATEFVVPEGYEYLGYDSCIEGYHLKRVYISSTISEVRSDAFDNSPYLEEIIVSDKNPYYMAKDGVLYSKDGTQLVRYPVNKKGSSFVVPDSVTEILSSAFDSCENLTRISMGKNVADMGSFFCFDYTKLYSVTISAENPYFKIKDGMILSKDGKLLYNLVAERDRESVMTPYGVTEICECAFCGCNEIKKVTVSQGVTTIGENAFSDCSKLEEIILPEGLVTIRTHAFEGCESMKSIKVPDSVRLIEWAAFYNSGVKELTVYSKCKVEETHIGEKIKVIRKT